jgi:GT2 family glycosyltransferase/glycosyltransferase involved in cell wall biosynthesis
MSNYSASNRADVIIVTPDIVGPVRNGGIGTACLHYARTLADAGIPVDVLFTGVAEPDAMRDWQHRYETLGIGLASLSDMRWPDITVHGSYWYTERAWQVLEFLRRREYRYVLFQDWHANGFWATRARQMGAAFGHTRFGLIAHSPTDWQKAGMETFGSSPLEEADLEWCERQTIAAVDVLISPSQHMVDWLLAHGYSLPPVVTVCPYTFEDAPRQPEPGSVDDGHVIFFGRLETRKGLHLFGGALRELAGSGGRLPRQVSLLGKQGIVEGIPSAQYLARLQTDLPTVDFIVRTDLDYPGANAYIRRARGIVVIPSLLDNYPLTVVESVVHGYRFIASSAGGIPEMVDPAVIFTPTVDGLRDMLARLPAIDFRRLHHRYDPARARTIWLEHVRRMTAPSAAGAVGYEPPRVEVIAEPPPPVSVCIPFYRHGHYLRRLVDSFLSMRLPQLQLVVIDDGTPPGELDEFRALRADLTPNGHIFRSQPNAGPGAARNRAIELAAHDLLLLFDADNVPFPNMVRALWEAMSRTNADSVAAPYVAIPPLSRAPGPRDVLFYFRPAGGSLSLALLKNNIGDIGSLIRRDVARAVGGFPTHRDCWEDWEFFFKIVSRGFRHLVYPDPLFYYTVSTAGRYNSASEYRNRLSLLSCLEGLDSATTAALAQVLAKQVLAQRFPGEEQRVLDAVYRSASWRVTAPLRRVASILRRMPESA